MANGNSTETLIAAALVGFCAIAAVGSWFSGHKPYEKSDKGNVSSTLFDKDSAIAVLDIDGMIMDQGGGGGFGGGGGASGQGLIKAIERIREDDVKAVILNINSPGGSAAASQAVFEELVRLKKDKGVKIVATMGDVAASGGYYIACAADTIIANPATLTGSIGVIMHLANYQGLMGKIGVNSVVIKSGRHKDIGSPDRPITPEEQKILQSIIDDTYQQFLDAVSAGRNMPMAKLRPLADGRIYTGRQALKAGLIDKLGNDKEAEAEARRLAKLDDDVDPKNYTEEGWKDMFKGVLSESRANPMAQMLGHKAAMLQSGAFDKLPLMLYE